MSAELLPCPFCGASARPLGSYLVACENMSCRLYDTGFSRKEWNRRAQQPATPAQPEDARMLDWLSHEGHRIITFRSIAPAIKPDWSWTIETLQIGCAQGKTLRSAIRAAMEGEG